MPSVRVDEPALCCNTGVCGEDDDQRLAAECTADLRHLSAQGTDITRHNLAHDPTRDQLLRYTGPTQAPVAVPAGAPELTVAENTRCGPTGRC